MYIEDSVDSPAEEAQGEPSKLSDGHASPLKACGDKLVARSKSLLGSPCASSAEIPEDFFDLVIVGGGLVGAGLAMALRHTELRIALVDARLANSHDPRLFALNSSSCQFLENLGLWPKLAPYATPIHQVHVSYQRHFGAVRLHREEVNLPSLGHVIPAHYIEAALNEALQKTDNTERLITYRPATLQSLQQQDHQSRLMLITQNGEKTLWSSLVIGADGTESTVRKQLNMATTIFDYEQSAIVTRTLLNRSHRSIAYERFTALGAIAMLPLTGNECATIWTADSKTITALMMLSDAEFLRVLQQEFGYRLGRLQHIRERHVFPLQMVRAEKAVEQNVFLLGNSAHTLHPIAAQGFNLSLYEVAALAEGILAKIRRHETFTAIDLQQISKQTQKQRATSIAISHRLSRIFSRDSFLLNILLQCGMVSLDVMTPLKKRFIEGMIGRTGSVPRLLLKNVFQQSE